MNRRDLLGTMGVALCGAAAANAAEHADAKGGKLMAPAEALHLHFCGIHVAKNNPKFQLITQHYCGKGGESLHQCILYDSTEKTAKLLGVEYIIPDEVFRKLPAKEKKYWHPHTYEVLGGGLIAPAMKSDDELAFMKALMLTWGKSWHTWPDPTTAVPLGEPLLMWSLTGDGQEAPKIVAKRDKMFGVDNDKIREVRGEAIGLELPDVPLPKDMDTIGRQWTADGDDKPKKRKKK